MAHVTDRSSLTDANESTAQAAAASLRVGLRDLHGSVRADQGVRGQGNPIQELTSYLVTACKRSFGQGNVFTGVCQSTAGEGGVASKHISQVT